MCLQGLTHVIADFIDSEELHNLIAGRNTENMSKAVDRYQTIHDHMTRFSEIIYEKGFGPMAVLYGLNSIDKVSEARYRLFTNKKKVPDPQKLPPSFDALILHLKRSNYQTKEWKNALNSIHDFVEPVGNGWKNSGCARN